MYLTSPGVFPAKANTFAPIPLTRDVGHRQRNAKKRRTSTARLYRRGPVLSIRCLCELVKLLSPHSSTMSRGEIRFPINDLSHSPPPLVGGGFLPRALISRRQLRLLKKHFLHSV